MMCFNLVLALSAACLGSNALELGSQRYLLFDDDWLEPGHTITFVEHSPQKKGVVLEADKPWESMGIWPWNTVLYEDGVYKMWYDAMTHRDPGKSGPIFTAHLAYATSKNGIDWEKRPLGLLPFDGSTANNICGQFGWLYGSVFRDPTGPDARRYKITYPGLRVINIAYSPDGLRWTPAPRPAVEHATDSADVMFWDDRLGKYVGYFRCNVLPPGERIAWRFNRQVWRSETPDIERWPAPVLNFRDDPRHDPPATDFYNNGVIKYPWAHHAYFMRPSAFYRPSDLLEIHLATSRDGVTWRRPGGNRAWIGVGPAGSFDSHQLYIVNGIVRVGDELWLYYTGFQAGHERALNKTSRHVGKIGRAALRLDGFVSARGGLQPGSLTTKPMRVSGRCLVLNYDAGATGEIRAELRDEANHPIPGFTLEECNPLFGNHVHGLVAWKKGSDVSALTAKPVRLHLVVRSADVYAFQFHVASESVPAQSCRM
jgi:hypothetical protein